MKQTNLSKAVEIVKVTPNKAQAMQLIIDTLGVKKANAYVYHTKATKLLKSGVKKVVIETRDVEADMEAATDRIKAVKNNDGYITNPFMPTSTGQQFQRYVGR